MTDYYNADTLLELEAQKWELLDCIELIQSNLGAVYEMNMSDDDLLRIEKAIKKAKRYL